MLDVKKCKRIENPASLCNKYIKIYRASELYVGFFIHGSSLLCISSLRFAKQCTQIATSTYFGTYLEAKPVPIHFTYSPGGTTSMVSWCIWLPRFVYTPTVCAFLTVSSQLRLPPYGQSKAATKVCIDHSLIRVAAGGSVQ